MCVCVCAGPRGCDRLRAAAGPGLQRPQEGEEGAEAEHQAVAGRGHQAQVCKEGTRFIFFCS